MDEDPIRPLLADYDTLLLDLDGVLYRGPSPVPHAAAAVDRAAASGLSIGYVTNNASRLPGEVAEQLRSMGLRPDEADIITSAQAGAEVVARDLPAGSRVLAVGGPGVSAALRQHGLVPVDALSGAMPAAGDDVAAVLQGFGRDVGWTALARATRAIRSGARFVATNTDMTVPTEWGTAPGTGTFVAAVSTGSGVSPTVVGKPHPPLLHAAVERTGAKRALFVGDRLDTDIRGATNAGLDSLLVLTGVSGALDLWRAVPEDRPTFLGADLRALHAAPLRPAVREATASCAGASARLVSGELQVDSGPDATAAIWATAHLIWESGHVPSNAPDVAARLG